MLGKTASGLFWMFRYLERAENTSRLVDAGFRIALTHSSAAENEWSSVLAAAGVSAAFTSLGRSLASEQVVDFMLRDEANPSSALSSARAARTNARLVRTALTREVWEATNDCWLTLQDVLSRPVTQSAVPETLTVIRQQIAQVRGALYGTMLRNDIFNFCHLGSFVERADNTARILDVKYYVLLPSVTLVGSAIDNVQWETILRAVSAHRAYRWLHGEANPEGIARFLIFDRRMPRSLAFCYLNISNNLEALAADYGSRHRCHQIAEAMTRRLSEDRLQDVFDEGLHEFLTGFLKANNDLAAAVEADYRFNE